MLTVELLGLFIAAAGALYGIWTKPNQDLKVAIISTAIAGVGLLTASILAIWKSIRAKKSAALAEERRKSEIQALLGASELSSLEIVWTFDAVPAEVLQILPLGDAIVDTHFLRNDERSRMPAELRERARLAWHLESTVGPLIQAIGTGAFDASLYQGEPIAEVLARWAARDNGEWSEQIGSAIRYTGPAPELIFPLNAQLNAALSLGKREDDVVLDAPAIGWHEDDPALFAETNFAFEAEAAAEDGGGFTLKWRYGPASLARAAVREAGARLVASLPTALNFLLVSRKLERTEYLTLAGREFAAPEEAPDRGDPSDEWNGRSTLKIYVNGLRNTHYTYTVTKSDTRDLTTDQGLYDAPRLEFQHTRFDCRLESL